MKINVSTSLEEEFLDRIARIAKELETSDAAIIRKCVKKYLPEMEREVLGEQFVGGIKNGRKAALAR